MLFAQDDPNSYIVWVLIGSLFGVFALIVFMAIFARYFSLWIQCKLTRADITLFQLIMMTFRKVNTSDLVRAKIMAVQAQLTRIYPVTTRDLEAHSLAGGNVKRVVQTSVYPKVIDCPDPKKDGQNATLSAVAADGVELRVRARVTVRTNLQQLIGGATEETVIARVGQGIVQAIGKTPHYKDVLEFPESISENVLALGLEKQTAFSIVSIDIADIDVGDNIGARLQADQAEADMRVARAKAEERRAMAVANEQVMKALTQENRARLVLAEAEIPRAMAEAYRMGNLRAQPASA
jgi:uncharacterized protein YqfA (UPF0365 family)